jgi:transcription-repair coupling factor (superfamily II helicase)
MEIDDLIVRYSERKENKLIIEKLLQEQKKIIHLHGLSGSSDAFVVAALQKSYAHPQLFILSDKEEAAFFLNNLENLHGKNNVLFFPSSYKKPYQIEEVDNANVLLRAEVLNRIRKTSGDLLVVTYPEALNEKVVTKRSLTQNTIDIRKGEQTSVDSLVAFLDEFEFEHTDFVIEAGQYAVRGGIIDIFSYANELPYRVEFSDDEIVSIRTFDPASQLKVQDINHITVIPNVQTKLLKESRDSFFEFIPHDTTVWVRDIQELQYYIKTNYEKAVEIFEYSENLIQQLTHEQLFETAECIIKSLSKFNLIEFGKRFYFNADLALEFKTSPQPSFNKNFNLLTEDLQKKSNLGYKNFMFADAAKQIERLYAIFEDIGKNIDFHPILLSIHEGYIDHDLKLVCYTDHQVFDRYHRFKLKQQYSKREALSIKELLSLNPGDFVTHIDHGVGRFAGLETIDVNGKPQEAVRLVYKDNDILYVSIHSLHRISKYSGKEGKEPVLNKLGSNAWSNLKQRTKKKVKDIARDLIKLYARRKAEKGFAFTPDTYLQNELEASFIYEDTPDQEKSTSDVKRDMEKPYPMDRLVCGDVGFGKTEIAVRAAFKAVTDSKQVAVLVPTTILAMQHYNTFKDRLKDFPCSIDYINRFKSTKHQIETLGKLEKGKLDIIIGTHRLLSKDVKFKNLGLLIIDEEQKFGVASKEKLKTLRVNVDTLTLTATPIPRTLHFSMMGARDLSVITTPPPNRVPITTELHSFNHEIIRDAIMYEVTRGGQIFFVHNRVQDIHEISGLIQKLCPDVKIAVGHGQMDGDKLEDVLVRFISGEYDVLVATTIIESGLDIPNANTIIINNAHHFGLSDLHQMRGRVGRSNKKAFCYLLAPPLTLLTPEARQRLRAIEDFSELGGGFNIAMRDLDIRGAGNLLGAEQSGFISEIGFDMYHKILDEAVKELKEEEFAELFAEDMAREKAGKKKFVEECQIDTDLEILIPSWYVSNITERLNLYKELDELKDETELQKFGDQLRDRFGPIPEQVDELMNTIRLRWLASELGLEKIVLKNNFFKGYFIPNPASGYFQSPVFTKVLDYVQKNPTKTKLKEDKSKLSITFHHINDVQKAVKLIEGILEEGKVEVNVTSRTSVTK